MYLGIQYASSGSVMPSLSSHCSSLSVLSISSWVLSLFEQRRRWAAVSRLPQVGHLSSGRDVPEYNPTCTLVPQNPKFCLDLQIAYMSDLFFSARSKCSQSILLKCSFGHGFFFLLPKYCLATSLLVWNLMEWDMLSVILCPQMTTAMSSLGNSWVAFCRDPPSLLMSRLAWQECCICNWAAG